MLRPYGERKKSERDFLHTWIYLSLHIEVCKIV